MKRKILSLIALVAILCTFALTVFAAVIDDGGVTPCYNNTAGTSTNFTITSAGKATISAVYNGNYGVTTGATVSSYIEKRTLGLFWTKVDIGEPNNEWVDTSTDYMDAFGHEFWLEDKGTYRATVVYEIRGTGGAADIIDYQQERTYS